MEFPPTGWEIFEDKDFETGSTHKPGSHVLELLVQARPSGRCADHWRLILGGSKILEAEVNLATICRSAALAPYKIVFQAWPKDVVIRRNMTTSAWLDGQSLLARREFTCFRVGSEGPCQEDEILQEMAKEEDIGKKSFSLRFAVVAGHDNFLHLELQGLPAADTNLMSKPALVG